MIKFLVGVAVVIGVLVGLDRLAAHIAEDRVATLVQREAHLPTRPAVQVDFPFLPQVFSGRYRSVTITATDIFTDRDGARVNDGARLRLQADGVHLSLSDVLRGDFHRVPVDTLIGTVTVPFDRIAAAAPIPDLSLAAVPGEPDELAIDVPAGSAHIQVIVRVDVEGTAIVISPVRVVGSGVGIVADATLRRQLGFRLAVPGLPTGMRLTTVEAGSDGVTVAAVGHDLVLHGGRAVAVGVTCAVGCQP
ncbi:MAG: DUF2993 domain-containing protein [Acidothermus sp.]|nr:DUF2993 domain-containing protein [Acidothermus sp.]MCL6537471.1 DUF2993 domain-containing protein [Acidothermus sp.]